MSNETPDTAGATGEPLEPQPVPDALVDPEAPIAAHPVDDADYEGTTAPSAAVETSVTEPAMATENPAEAELPAEPALVEPAQATIQTVYVHAPVPPRKRGNRGVGGLIAILSAIVFAAIFAGVALVVMPLLAPKGAGFVFTSFIGSAVFYVPILVFAVAFVLLVLIVNRANWWAHVLGSFIVALVVYFVSIGILLLVNGVIDMTPSAAADAFRDAAISPLLIIATIVAREVALWFGAIIAARGRRLKVRNAEERTAFERELADRHADYDRATVGYATN